MRISDWSSDVCSSDLTLRAAQVRVQAGRASPIEAERANVARVNADAALTREERAVEVARFTLSRIIGQPIAGPLDTDWFSRAPATYGPLRPIDSTGTLMMAAANARLEERSVGKECVSTCRSRLYPLH